MLTLFLPSFHKPPTYHHFSYIVSKSSIHISHWSFLSLSNLLKHSFKLFQNSHFRPSSPTSRIHSFSPPLFTLYIQSTPYCSSLSPLSYLTFIRSHSRSHSATPHQYWALVILFAVLRYYGTIASPNWYRITVVLQRIDESTLIPIPRSKFLG